MAIERPTSANLTASCLSSKMFPGLTCCICRSGGGDEETKGYILDFLTYKIHVYSVQTLCSSWTYVAVYDHRAICLRRVQPVEGRLDLKRDADTLSDVQMGCGLEEID